MDEPEFFSSEEDPEQPLSDVKRRFTSIGRRLAQVASTVGGALARSAEAAAEVLTDADLRRRGAQAIADSASKGLRGLQQGLQTGATGIQRGLQTVQRGPKQIQAVLLRVQHQIEQQRMAALLEEQRDAPVDVQVGAQCYEDSPQELRSRLWMAILEHPELVTEYQAVLAQQRANCLSARQPSRSASASAAASPATAAAAALELSPPQQQQQRPQQEVPSDEGNREGEPGGDASSAAREAEEGGESGAAGPACADQHLSTPKAASSLAPAAAPAGGSSTAAAPAESMNPRGRGRLQQEGEGAEVGVGHMLPPGEPAGNVERSSSQAQQLDAGHIDGTPRDAGHLSPVPSRSRTVSPSGRSAGALGVDAARTGNSSARGEGWRAGSSRRHSGAAMSSGTPDSSSDASSGGWGVGSEEWEVVEEGKRRQGQALLAGNSSGGLAAGNGYNKDMEAFRNKLMTAMMAVPWPLPTEYPEECRYSTLLQISVGQEEVDEIISRDIHRTFPEHPLFGFEQGQQALFRVLKAYSLHDIEVNYCQGMAFVSGLLLFYMNEEPAFQLFCRLLGASGPNLRRLYLPGLEGLKAELRAFELLMARHLPNLKAHLEAYGVVPVLFASQWFLTAFSCPFPVHFACRVVDVLVVEGDDSILLRAAMAIMAECEADLFMLDDFEEIITYLKVEPVQWPLHRVRRVLDAAVHSPITPEELAEVAAAVEEGYSGSLARGTSSLEGEGPGGFFDAGTAGAEAGADAAAAAAAPAAPTVPIIASVAERARSLRHHSRGSSLGQAIAAAAADWQAEDAALAAAAQQQQLGAAGREEGQLATAAPAAGAQQQQQQQQAGGGAGAGLGGVGGDHLEAELARQQADLDEDYLSMVLALDMMLTDSGREGSGVGDAYEAALSAQHAQQQHTPPGAQ